ncbi:MAG: class I SAM-dependent rRNA methyltransferase [Geobacter sp.]|nr:class I SAM-dependent rRNA methyltransferase [Geobacter sp.]
MLKITLHKGEDRRVRTGHPWVFSNEIAHISGERKPGAVAELLDANGAFLGTGYYNPHSLISFRLLSHERADIDSPDFFAEKLKAVLTHRQEIYPHLGTFRLVHGEGDFLPGLVVDKYGDFLSIQLLTAGMDSRRDLIVEALTEIFQPRGIVARNDVAVRGLEGLSESVEVLAGEIPAQVEVEEHGIRLLVDLKGGQKTGHFLDQKENHLLLDGICAGKEMLDCFSYSGSWGMHAAKFGAQSITCLDISGRAVGLVGENARLNSFGNIVTAEEVDVFERLRQFKGSGRRFDVIVMDPPAFVKNRKALKEAEKGYTTINRRALELLNPGGYLITCSCSFHMGRELFHDMLAKSAQLARRDVRFIQWGRQAPDHPVLLSVPETDYLKCAVLQVV